MPNLNLYYYGIVLTFFNPFSISLLSPSILPSFPWAIDFLVESSVLLLLLLVFRTFPPTLSTTYNYTTSMPPRPTAERKTNTTTRTRRSSHFYPGFQPKIYYYTHFCCTYLVVVVGTMVVPLHLSSSYNMWGDIVLSCLFILLGPPSLPPSLPVLSHMWHLSVFIRESPLRLISARICV